MTSRQVRLSLPRIRRTRLTRCVTAWTLVWMGMLGAAAIAWGQGDRSPAVLTEIWMSGEDLAVTRRIPQDSRSAQQAYDEVAQSLVIIAELRYQDRDEETAEWLQQWAGQLTDGRIGKSPRTTGRQQQHDEYSVPNMTQSESLEDQIFLPLIPAYRPAGLVIEWPISAFTDELSPSETRPIDYKLESLHGGRLRDDKRELVSAQQTNAEQAADRVSGRDETRSEADVGPGADLATQRSHLSEPSVNSPDNPPDNVGRQVALVPSYKPLGFANRLQHAAPAVPTEQPTMLALSCFAAGVVCCFVLHTLLLLTPVRLTVCRPEASSNRTLDRASAPASPSGKELEPAGAVAFTTRSRPPTRDLTQHQDKASSMVEEFYNSNIELFERFARLGD